MERESRIEEILDDMKDWLKREPVTFWEHVRQMEYDYLSKMSDAELGEIA